MTAPDQATLTLVVDEEKNRVVFAHVGKDFVDVMVSFLTLPLGTIARLVAKESNMMKKVSVGCLSSLYESVAILDVKLFWTEACKEMLLRPRNSMEAYCSNMKLNIDDTEKVKYFICQNLDCTNKESGGLLSTFRNTRCKCGKLMNKVILPEKGMLTYNEGFIPDMATFIISDDLKLKPYDIAASVLPGIQDLHATKEVTVNVTKEKMVDLLKCSLLSKTPLTDFFLRKTEFPQYAAPQPRNELVFNFGPSKADDGGVIISLKVFIRKSNSKILFALAENDFVDLVFSFLTFPLGGMEQMLKGNSCLGSIDNLYKSMLDLDGCKYLRSFDLKDKFVNYRLAHQFKIERQILPFDEVPTSNFICCSENNFSSCYLTKLQGYHNKRINISGKLYAPLSYLEPQSSTGEPYSNCGGRGFVKKPSMYMVKDDLVVTPASPFSTITFLTKSGIPLEDLEERIISIGNADGLNILKASLISSSALTNGLAQFLKPLKNDNIPIKMEKIYRPLNMVYPRLFSIFINKDISVAEVRSSTADQGWIWSFTWRRNLFIWEEELLSSLLQYMPDLILIGSPTLDAFLSKLWNNFIPSKVSGFMWKLLLGRLCWPACAKSFF
ncbi:hypothetical protein RIF29_30388 [Crotalaria pallida]|uniref:DUF674 family protein n=1 Tax=Crotalaria pallida TaxID=3830 RepID=A0AAN9EGF3_CROPI